MKLILVAPDSLLCAAFQQHFNYLPNIEIVNNYFEWLPDFDCMVSPANSFGMMDGGIDAAIIRFFGDSLMAKVQQRILEDYLGEQSVGTSMIVETGHHKHPFLAHTPTMRVPMIIAGTDIPYIAMWAMLLAVRQHNQHAGQKINTIACPGLGTGIGRVPYTEAARQMALAYDRMALRKGKIVEAAGVQRSGGAGEKEEILGIAFRYLEIPLCSPAPLLLCNPYAAYLSA